MKILSRSSRVGEEENCREEKKGLSSMCEDKETKEEEVSIATNKPSIGLGPALSHLSEKEAYKELAKRNKKYSKEINEGRII